MKTFYIKLLSTLFLINNFNIAQWREFSDPIITQNLNSIFITSDKNVFAVGGNIILGWGIGGPSPWSLEFDTNTEFYSIYFSSNNYGFAVGSNSLSNTGIITRTTDGGNWTAESSILGNSILKDVYFINNTIGLVVGHDNASDAAIIGKSYDGGISWAYSIIPTIEFAIMNSINFIDETAGWSVGTGDASGFGKILRTTDGGDNWFDQPISISGVINDLYFVNNTVGWICTGDGEILKTSDGGNNWSSQYSSSGSINSISFIDENYGWGVGDNGLILYTTNGGLNWLLETSNISTDLNSIFTSSDLPYSVCGDAGEFMLREIFTALLGFTPMDGSSAVGDYDNDGDLDIALTGVIVTLAQKQQQVDDRYTEIYKNNGDLTFTKITDQIIKVSDGSLDWGDYDNDGDLDLLLSGFYEEDLSAEFVTKIYRNDDNDKFIEVQTSLDGFDSGFLKWGDLDNDGDLDIVSSAGLYCNDGRDNFVEKTSALSELGFAAGALGDVDNDGDIDIIAGLRNASPKVFINLGEFNFTEIALPQPTNIDYFDLTKLNTDALTKYNSFFENSGSSAYYGSCDLGDYDNDGDLDILWIQTSYDANETIIYKNVGNNNFTELTNSNLPGLMLGSGVFIDFDNDGDLDVFLSGGNTYNDEESGIYRNDGSDTFSQVPFYYGEWETISWSSTNSGDFDNDGDVDLLVVGEMPHLQGASKIFSNNCVFPSSPPTVPSNLQSQINYGDVTINWNKSTDNETPQIALNYNIYLGTSPAGIDIVSPMSVLSSGYRGIVNQGNTNHNNSWTIKGLEPGTYYWSVQAIDNNYAGSNFSTESSFNIGQPNIIVTTPNGGQWWKTGWNRDITWSSSNIANINLYYSSDNGTNWNPIVSNIAAATGAYEWEIPLLTNFISPNCKVKIEDASNSSNYDVSDNNFILWHPWGVVRNCNLGQQILDFLETNVDISLDVTTAGDITVTYYPGETPVFGTLPSEIVVISDYFWHAATPGASFNNGKMIIPISTLRGVTDATKLVWLKRGNSGDPWENIGGIVSGENLESVVSFNSFSEFAIGSTDPINPLPVELSSFIAISKPDHVILKWETKTETSNYGFDIERKVSDQWQKIGFINGNGNSNSPKVYSYSDKSPTGGSKFQYRLRQIDNDGQFEYSKIVEVELILNEYALYQNYPNPFNPTTKIRYQLPAESKVVIKVYNIIGSEVMELFNEQKEAGIYEVEFNASELSSGTYIYKISADNFMQTKKMILLK